MICAGCRRVLEVGDQYIEGSISEYMGHDVKPDVGDIMHEVFGSGPAGKIIYCEDCTERGEGFLLNTYYGDDDD